MNVELQKVITEWIEYAKLQVQSTVGREAHFKINQDLACALVGVRRSGKTTLACQQIFKSSRNFLYINFEDPYFSMHSSFQILDELLSEYSNLYNREPDHIIFDEVHNIVGWERWVRKFVDRKKGKIVITGSSSKMLSGEFSTALTGRNLTYEIWPLTFQEYVNFKNIPNHPEVLLQAFSDFIRWGAFPRVVTELDPLARKQLLLQYYTDTILKDVVQRNEIRDVNSLLNVFNYYLTNISSLHSYTSIKNAFGLSLHAPAAYTQALTSAFLIFEVKVYSKNLKVQNRHPKKVYAIDTGFRNANASSASYDYGKLLENAVYLELRKRQKNIYYHKGQYECDFIVAENYRPTQLIQVTESISNEQTKERELAGLTEAMKLHRIQEGLILTQKDEGVITTPAGKVQIIPAWKHFVEI